MELSPVCTEDINTDGCIIKSDRGHKRSKVPSKLDALWYKNMTF